jgi:hypothetical protein
MEPGVSTLSVPELLAECRRLLAEYYAVSGLNEQRLVGQHGGGCPDDDRPNDVAWWYLRVLPDSAAVYDAAIRSTTTQQRLALALYTLQSSIQSTQRRTGRQAQLVGVVCTIALVMFLLRHYRMIEFDFDGY